MEDVLYNLTKQTHRVLSYLPEYENEPEEALIARAQDLALAFLARIPHIREYIDTDVQAEFDGENYEAPDLPPDGDGRSLRVACVEDGYPRSFFDMRTGEALGFDVEVLRQWAGERGYHLDFTATNYDDMALGLQSGRYDIGVGYISSLYREEADKIGLFTSDSFVEIPTHFCQKGAGDISINGEVD